MAINIHSASIKTSICAICAQNGPTYCQLGQRLADFSFPVSGVETEIISACDSWQGMFYRPCIKFDPIYIPAKKSFS
jgi:hypothetical protein